MVTVRTVFNSFGCTVSKIKQNDVFMVHSSDSFNEASHEILYNTSGERVRDPKSTNMFHAST